MSVFGTMVMVFVAFAFYSIQRTSDELMSSVEQHAELTSAVIERAIHYCMLLNRKDDVHTTLRNIADGPGISAIRIYDKNGTIIFCDYARPGTADGLRCGQLPRRVPVDGLR